MLETELPLTVCPTVCTTQAYVSLNLFNVAAIVLLLLLVWRYGAKQISRRKFWLSVIVLMAIAILFTLALDPCGSGCFGSGVNYEIKFWPTHLGFWRR